MFKKKTIHNLTYFNIERQDHELWILSFGKYEFVNTTKRLACSENDLGYFSMTSYASLKEIFDCIDNEIFVYIKNHKTIRPTLGRYLLTESDKVTMKKLIKKIK